MECMGIKIEGKWPNKRNELACVLSKVLFGAQIPKENWILRHLSEVLTAELGAQIEKVLPLIGMTSSVRVS